MLLSCDCCAFISYNEMCFPFGGGFFFWVDPSAKRFLVCYSSNCHLFFSFIGFHPYFLLISSSPVLHLCFLAWQQYPFLRVFVIKNLKWEITWPLTSNTRLNLFWRLSGNNQDWAIILIACCSMPYIVQLSRKDGFMGVYRQGAWARGVLVSLFPVWRETPSWSHGFAKAKMRKHWLFGGQPGCQVWVCHWCSYFYLCCVSTSK